VVSRGRVYWFEHPDTRRRPVLVLTRDAAIPVLTGVLVAFITTKVRGIPTEVALDIDDGMPTSCVITLDNLATIPVGMLTEPITRLDGARMHQVCVALAVATGCGVLG
jgi:mRNA interferase MazF